MLQVVHEVCKGAHPHLIDLPPFTSVVMVLGNDHMTGVLDAKGNVVMGLGHDHMTAVLNARVLQKLGEHSMLFRQGRRAQSLLTIHAPIASASLGLGMAILPNIRSEIGVGTLSSGHGHLDL